MRGGGGGEIARERAREREERECLLCGTYRRCTCPKGIAWYPMQMPYCSGQPTSRSTRTHLQHNGGMVYMVHEYL